jgi:hypothetical protein
MIELFSAWWAEEDESGVIRNIRLGRHRYADDGELHGWKFYPIEIRPLHEEPCPWEKSKALSWPGRTNEWFIIENGDLFCRMCGRKL